MIVAMQGKIFTVSFIIIFVHPCLGDCFSGALIHWHVMDLGRGKLRRNRINTLHSGNSFICFSKEHYCLKDRHELQFTWLVRYIWTNVVVLMYQLLFTNQCYAVCRDIF